ncbi:hypothetical protein [Streptomyces sp. NRRL F-4428]|uniref:hypothetical protein n=1 Tax=Streptomyces sp. NRRL F-4428 TaxID=1609137 RepID=UPI000698C0B2|nr:hypothetical protein [Streptomyces sp. NRRL F-4428]
MITDPELDGAWETGRAGERAEAAEELAPPGCTEGVAGARRPWLWALGGAVAASVLWAGGLYAFGEKLAAPGISYRATENLCEDFRAQALGRIAGDLHRYRPMNQQNDHPAVRGAICSLQNGESVSTLTVRAQMDLHKKTDPEAEFEVPSRWRAEQVGAGVPESVQGLGERAVVIVMPGGTVQLQVLDGGAVFTLEASGSSVTGNAPGDTAALKAAMVQDARELMSALRK